MAATEAERNNGTATAGSLWRAGSASCGKVATATDRAGNGSAAAVATIAARKDEPITPM
jgi:hypothetical protein